MKVYLAYLEKLKPYLRREVFFMYIFPVIFVLGIIFGFFHILKIHDHETQSVSAQLNTVQRALDQLSYHNQNPEDFKETLSNISNTMISIQKSIDQSAKSSDVDKITTQTTMIKQNIEELKKLIAENGNGKEYLDVKALPFKVISVDVISEQPFVSIDYQHHITPMDVGNTIAGWEIVSADYDHTVAEFKNNKGQYVKVNLQG